MTNLVESDLLKVAVSATGVSMDASIDPRFGRCPYYVIVDTETMSYETMPNANMSAPSGAGIAAAQAVAQRGVEAVLTGNFGPNASQVLSQVGIKMITGATGSVRQAVESFNNGSLTAASPSTASVGTAPRVGLGMGMGGGMGMGRGRGMGQGRGMGRGMGRSVSNYPPQPSTYQQQPNAVNMRSEKNVLTQQLEQLERQLIEVKKRLEELK